MTSTSDHRSAREIEADLERERAGLADTLDELQDRVSIDRLSREALGLIRSNAGSYARSLDEAVRANPIALAVTAAGLAWLVFGGKSGGGAGPLAARRGRVDPAEDWTSGRETPPAFGTRAAAESYGSGAPTSGYSATGSGLSAHDSHDDHDEHGWTRRIDQMRAEARDRVRRLEDGARSRARSLRGRAHHGYEGSRDYAAERASVLGDFARDMREGFMHGLEDLTEGARSQIVAARERAYAARLRAERMARESGSHARDAYGDHPLALAALAMAAGAGAAALLPRTRIEDRTFGSESDRLMQEAREMLRAERARAVRVARGVGEEVQDSMRDLKDRATDAVQDAARDVRAQAAETADRAKDRARDEAARRAPASGPAAASAMGGAGTSRDPGIEDLPGRGPSSPVPGGDVAPAEEVPARPGFGPDTPGEDLPGDTLRGGATDGKGGAGSAGAGIGTSDTPKPGTTRGPKG